MSGGSCQRPQKKSYRELLLIGDEGALAGDASPCGVLLDPGVSEAGSVGVWLAFECAGFAVDSGSDGGIAENADGNAFIEEVIGFEIGFRDRVEVFGLVHQSAVVVDVGKRIGDDGRDGGGVTTSFGLIPGAFELLDLDFVPSGGGFFLSKESGAQDDGER